MRQVLSGNGFQDSGRQGARNSGDLRIPGKTFFLRLAANVIREVFMVRDKDGVSVARNVMLQCCLGLKNGVWEISQLKPELQGIIRENMSHFDGEPVPSLGADVEDSSPDK